MAKTLCHLFLPLYLSRAKHKLTFDDRNIDEILSAATPSDYGELYYKDYGLLLCEAHMVRELARKTFPKTVFRKFRIKIDQLTDIKMGLKRQKETLERIYRTYSIYF